MTRSVSRSKFAVDIMYRLWDETRQCWVTSQGRSIWATRGPVETLRDKMIEEGRNPTTLQAERVLVKVQ